MKILPIIPVRTGRVTDIRFEEGLVSGDARYDIFTVMTKLGEAYDSTYFMDLSAYSSGDQQIELLKTLCEVNEVWVDPGIERSEEIIDPLIAGGEWVIMGTSTMDSLTELEEAVDLSDRIIPAIHWASGSIIRSYKTKQQDKEDVRHHMQLFLDLGLESVIFMDLPKIDRRLEFDPYLIDLLVGRDLEVYIAGGIREQDVMSYSEKGISGVLLTINEMLAHLERKRTKRVSVTPIELPEYEPAVQLSSIGMPEFH